MSGQMIDFVVSWLDNSDPAWLEEKNKYSSEGTAAENSTKRYRDWGLLRFWFRGVEKFAPWVRRIHFVTCGHLPKWLNQKHPKIHVVKHSDYIPEEFLPTFSSRTIELNIHRISGLADQFVYFNDDMFLINKLNPEDFFKDNMPCDLAVLGAVLPQDEPMTSTIFNDVKIINRFFRKTDLTIRQWRKVLCPCYGQLLIRTICLYPFSKHTGFYDPHLGLSFTKELFSEVWEKVPKELTATCRNKFRTQQDCNIWMLRYWNLAKGNFVPRGMIGRYFEIGDEKLIPYIWQQKGKMICCNDVRDNLDFDEERRRLAEAFTSILPEKSEFEK